jgi:hypothetical protein
MTDSDIFGKRYNDLVEECSDLSKYSLEQLEELEHRTKQIKTEYENFQLVVKCDANSLYGTSANIFNSLCDYDIAEDITMGGKYFCVKVDIGLNNLFKTWEPKGNEFKIIQEFYPQVTKLRQFTEYIPDSKQDVCVYGDTDSRYIDLGIIYSLFLTEKGPLPIPDEDKELSEFAVYINEKIIAPKIKEIIDYECENRNARRGYLKMAHEVTSRKSIFMKKKKYIMTLIYKDGKFFPKRRLKLVGVSLRKGSSAPKIKKILQTIIEKYTIDEVSVDILRNDILKIISYIKQNKSINHSYLISSVSGLKDIKFENDIYSSDKTHIQMQIALSWMNFIYENDLTQIYKKPFEGQKMKYFYCEENSKYKVFGVPDDVDIAKIPNIPKPDFNKMLIQYLLVKEFLRYTLDKETIENSDCINFLLGVKPVTEFLN